MRATFRPLPAWPHPDTRSRRSRWAFKAKWQDTLDLLEREIAALSGHDMVIGGGWREQDIRLDGLPRAEAREPAFPGVEISFEVPGRPGRLVYASDACEFWQHNIRSIALGLEALRAVDRYGITRKGEQYAGFAQLPAGGPDPDRGRRLVDEAGGIREALRRHHPDNGGNSVDFSSVVAYRDAETAAGREP